MISYYQDVGIPYLTIGFPGTEIGTILNVPNIDIVYVSVVYFYTGSPTDVEIGFHDFSNNVIDRVFLDASAADPTITSSTLTISTVTTRALKMIVNGSLSKSNEVNIRTIQLGYA
jgi:hypothetical protein